MTPAPTATERSDSTWSDAELDTSERATFLEVEGGGRILAFLHGPLTRTPIGAVVLCGSIFEDFQVNYRRECLVARELARLGVATVRFHYRGFGNSDAAPDGGVSFGSMLADSRAARDYLVAETGVTAVTWLGNRVGALVASHHAVGDEGAPLVLWGPVPSGADYFKGMSRASLIAGVRATSKKKDASASAEQRLKTEPSVEMLGNRVFATTYEDLRVRKYPTSFGARRMLLVQLGVHDALTAPNEALVKQWRDSGAEVEVLHVKMRQMWSIPTRWEPEDLRPEALSLIEGVPRWIHTTMQERS